MQTKTRVHEEKPYRSPSQALTVVLRPFGIRTPDTFKFHWIARLESHPAWIDFVAAFRRALELFQPRVKEKKGTNEMQTRKGSHGKKKSSRFIYMYTREGHERRHFQIPIGIARMIFAEFYINVEEIRRFIDMGVLIFCDDV